MKDKKTQKKTECTDHSSHDFCCDDHKKTHNIKSKKTTDYTSPINNRTNSEFASEFEEDFESHNHLGGMKTRSLVKKGEELLEENPNSIKNI